MRELYNEFIVDFYDNINLKVDEYDFEKFIYCLKLKLFLIDFKVCYNLIDVMDKL